jgi:hypothetical protein
MVKIKQFQIDIAQAGQDTILIPEFAGLDLIVSRRGIGDLLPSEVATLPEGGFSLVGDVFYEEDVFTVTPLPKEYQFPYWQPRRYNITGGQVGSNQIIIPEFAGHRLRVSRRGIGELLPAEFLVLQAGGFQLASGVFVEGDVFTVTPQPADFQYPTVLPRPFTRYPHMLRVVAMSASTQNANGDWEQGEEMIIETHCRAEPAVRVNDGLQGAIDGRIVNYAWIIYMPANAPQLGVGAIATITDLDLQVIASDTIKRFSRGQLNVRAWL